MKLRFLGTRGNIEARTPEHFKHAALSVDCRGWRVVIDCGADWLREANRWAAEAIVITHGHPDHIDGLKRGAPRPVYGAKETWELIGRYPIRERMTVIPGREFRIGGITFVAFRVENSLRASALGYRITAAKSSVFYCPELVFIRRRREALADISAYIGDGATVSGSLVHKRGPRLIGHSPIVRQLAWCREAGVPRAIITHCDTQIVTAEPAVLQQQVNPLSCKCRLHVEVARDGMDLNLRVMT
jgi:phosphoribosyl 1,2-cyclic phosphodiesterase